jgi:hypothetical protein
MAFVIAVVVSVSRYSSTTNKPAISAFKKASCAQLLLPIQLRDEPLSATVEPVAVNTTPFTVIDRTLFHERYLKTTVSHKFCVIVPGESTDAVILPPFINWTLKFVPPPSLINIRLFEFSPLPMSKTLS